MPDNETTPETAPGGQGEDFDPHHSRELLKMATSAVLAKRPMTDAKRTELIKFAEDIAENGNAREKLRAIELLNAMDCKYVDQLLELWDRKRVTEGKTTQNIGIDFNDAQLLAAADILDGTPPAD